MKDIGIVRYEMRQMYKIVKNWRRVGKIFGVTGAMAWRICNDDYEPATAAIRTTLMLPAMVETPACPICGEIHVKRGCSLRRSRGQRKDLLAWDVEDLKKAILNREALGC